MSGVAMLPAVITPGAGIELYLILAIVLCAVMAMVSTVYVTLGSGARRSTGNPMTRRRVDHIAGGILIGSGDVVTTR